jgi:hypothetical protein
MHFRRGGSEFGGRMKIRGNETSGSAVRILIVENKG